MHKATPVRTNPIRLIIKNDSYIRQMLGPLIIIYTIILIPLKLLPLILADVKLLKSNQRQARVCSMYPSVCSGCLGNNSIIITTDNVYPTTGTWWSP